MFIPHTDGDVKGKAIHAIGSPFTGYQLEIKEYDISKTKKSHKKISLGSIDEVGCPILTPRPRVLSLPGSARSRWIHLE